METASSLRASSGCIHRPRRRATGLRRAGLALTRRSGQHDSRRGCGCVRGVPRDLPRRHPDVGTTARSDLRRRPGLCVAHALARMAGRPQPNGGTPASRVVAWGRHDRVGRLDRGRARLLRPVREGHTPHHHDRLGDRGDRPRSVAWAVHRTGPRPDRSRLGRTQSRRNLAARTGRTRRRGDRARAPSRYGHLRAPRASKPRLLPRPREHARRRSRVPARARSPTDSPGPERPYI